MPKKSPWLYTTALDKPSIIVSQLQGWEGISKLYEFHLLLDVQEEIPYSDSDIEEILDRPAVLYFDNDTDAHWHGIIRELEIVDVVGGEGGSCRYRAVLVPALWYLTQNIRSRCFLDMTVPEIVKQVLTDTGFDSMLEDKLTGTYPKREFTVQYQESDFDFISRLLEHEGIFYFFEQTAKGEKVLLGDGSSAFSNPPDYDEVRYDPRSTNVLETPAIHAITRQYSLLPETMVLRDYNWLKPASGLHAGQKINKGGYGMQVFYGDHFTDDDGTRLTKLRVEEQVMRNNLYKGRSSLRNLRAGHVFTLVGHPDPDRFDIKFVVTELRHTSVMGDEGSSGAGYRSELGLLPQDVPFRPPRTTRRPKIHGIMNAKVDGDTPGLPAPIDEHGRYRLLFPYDLFHEPGTKMSRWVRMAQSFSGQGYGSHYPLHIGAEVLVSHIDGNPDRPIIVGAIHNEETQNPVVQENATQSITRTLGDIVVEFDDDAQVEATPPKEEE